MQIKRHWLLVETMPFEYFFSGVGVFASGGALLHVIFNLLWLDAVTDTEPDFYHQALSLFYLHYSNSGMPQVSL